jgi:hypothetical protein
MNIMDKMVIVVTAVKKVNANKTSQVRIKNKYWCYVSNYTLNYLKLKALLHLDSLTEWQY